MLYTRKKLIELLDLNSQAKSTELEETIVIIDVDLERFKDEIYESYMDTLEEYSTQSQIIYNFLFK